MSNLGKYITVVIRMPESPGNRKKIADALQLGSSFHGGLIVDKSLEDEMTVLDCIEQHEDFPDHIADEARAMTEALHAEHEAS